MPRKNLAGSYSGESERLTVRVSLAERRALDELAAAWSCDRSEAIRRAVRDQAEALRNQRREDTLARLDAMTVAELRDLAGQLRIRGRSRKTGPELRTAIRGAL